MKCFDIAGDSFVQYDDFFKGVRGVIKYCRKQLINNLFQKLDKNKQGYLTIDDITSNFNINTYPPVAAGKLGEEDGWKHFLYSWDLNEDRITPGEFMDYFLDIGGLIYDDDDFEAILKSSWNVDF